ncbi:YceI family protein [Bdellovibrionota bacterium FG-2]
MINSIFAVLAMGFSSSILAAPAAAPLEVIIQKASGSVEFLAIGRPSALRIRGKGAGPEGVVKVSRASGKPVAQGLLRFELALLDTGIDSRTEHMKEKYLEVAKFPQAVLSFSDLALPDSSPVKGKVAFKGELTFHGVTHAIAGSSEIMEIEKSFVVEAEFPVKLSEFKVEIPNFAGITVAEDVTVTVHFDAPFAASGVR